MSTRTMSTRTISTRLAIEGEAEYKAKLKSINAELALHKSELEKVQARYKDSANGLEALSAKQSALQRQIEALNQKHSAQASMLERAQQAQREYAYQVEQSSGKLERAKARLEELKNSAGDTSAVEAKLAAEIEKHTKSLDAAEEAMQKAANTVTYYQKQLNNTERDQYKLGDELKRTERYLDEAKASADGCAHSIDQYGKEVKGAGESAEDFAAGAQRAGAGIEHLGRLLAAAGVAGAVKEIADALNECVDTFASFQSQMSAVEAISGATGAQLAALGDKAQAMGATTAFTATEAAQALEYMAMAGWKTDDMLGGLEGVMHLAAASGESLASTSDIVTDALTAFGLTARDSARFSDVLAAASANANTNVGMMGETFKYAAPVAGSLGYSIEDTALAIGLMANSGIKGSEAGTALRTALTNLAKPSDTVAAYMEELGVSLTDSAGNVRSLSGLIGLLRDRFSDLSEAEQAEYAAGLAGKEGMSGLLAIVNASEADYQKLTSAIETCNGAAERMAETRLDNFAGQMTLLSSAADGLKLAVGQQLTPALTDLAKAGTDVLTWGADFIGQHPEVVAGMSALAAATGVLTVGAGALTVAYIAQAHAEDIAAAKMAILNVVTAANPFVLAATAAAALVAALGAYVAVMEGSSDSTKKFTGSLQESKAAYDDLMASMGEEKASTQSLADSLKGLLAVEDKSAAQKAVIAKKIDELNEAVPGLNLAYDEASDSLSDVETGMKLTVDAMDAMLERAAKQDEYNAQVDRLSELYSEQAEIAARLKDATAELAEAEEGSADAGYQSASAYAAASGAQETHATAVAGLSATVNELTAAEQANAAQIAELEAATAAYEETQAAAIDQGQAQAAAVAALREQMAALQVSYVESKAKAIDSLERQMGLFEEMDGKAKTTIEELTKTLSNQAKYTEDYAANIKKAMELGVDEGLVKKLSDGSQQSAQILDAIVKGGSDDIAALNAEFAKVEEGKNQFGGLMAEMELDFSKKMANMTRELADAIQEMNEYEEARKVGQNNIQGLIDGSSDPGLRGALEAKYRQLALGALAAYKAAVDQHSPSREFAKAGGNDIQGLIEGAEGEFANLSAVYGEAARVAWESYRAASEEGRSALEGAKAALDAMDSLFAAKDGARKAKYELWERTDGKYAGSAEKYKKQLEMLDAQMKEQETVVRAAEEAHKAMVSQYGDACQASYEYEKRLLEEKLALQDLRDELERVTEEKQKLALQTLKQQIQLEWDTSGVGRAAAASKGSGGMTPYEAAAIAGTDLIMPDGTRFSTAYADATQGAMTAMARHYPSTMEEPRESQAVARQLETITAAAVNAMAGAAGGGVSGPLTINVVMPDGKVLASVVADPLVAQMEANGTPIVNVRR